MVSVINGFSQEKLRLRRYLLVRAVLALAVAMEIRGQQIAPSAQRQIAALLSEKASRTPSQRKMSSHLVHAAKVLRGETMPPDFPSPANALAAVRLDAQNFVEVDVSGEITPELLEYIRTLRGTVVNSFPEYHTVRARLPLLAVEQLADRQEVAQVQPSEQGHRHQMPAVASQTVVRGRNVATQVGHFFGGRSNKKRGFGQPIRSAGAAFAVTPDFSGDVAHQANVARASFGVNGSGVKIGVLSDGVDSAAIEKAGGRLPAVQVIAGQGGSGDEGTAMLEVVYSLAPGAKLYFATAGGGQGLMANNIQALADAGCQIIIDDTYYVAEPVFQDGIVAQKINAVAAAGVFYFSAAGNEGSASVKTSEVWEGDFASLSSHLPAFPATIDVQDFGDGSGVDQILMPSEIGEYTLKWSDPAGKSSNDYDFFILDSTRSQVIASSTNVQSGTQNPYEQIFDADWLVWPGDWIVVVRNAGAAVRALHVDALVGQLARTTPGSISGHSGAASVFTVGAVDVHTAQGGAFTGGQTATHAIANPAELFSADGPRRMFLNPDGTDMVPGSVIFGPQRDGGVVLQKPDFIAADGVPTGLADFNPFYGTSAAVPHAAAIAALVIQTTPSITVSEMRAALAASALGPQVSSQYGAGIVMAEAAIIAGSGCSYSISPGGQAFSFSGGEGTISVTTPSGCPWTLSTNASWISGIQTGNGTASYIVGANSGAARSTSFVIGNRTFTVEQQASSIAGLNMVSLIPHVAAEENWITTFTLVNKSAAAAQERFSLFAENGLPLQLPLVLPQQVPAAGPLLGASLDNTLAPNASLVISTGGPTTPPVQVGSAELATAGAVDGFAIFHQIVTAQEAVVPLETRNASSYLLAYDNTEGVGLGVALANLTSHSVTIAVNIRNESGSPIANLSTSLEPSGHASFVLSNAYPITANGRGTIAFTTPVGGQIGVIGIRTTPLDSGNTFTTIPALANIGTTGGSIAHIASGNGWQTTFVLVNAGAVSSQAHLKFFADNGSPLSLPLGFPQTGSGTTMVASTVDRTLAAGATLLIEGAGPASDPTSTIGSAQLTTDGNIGGFVIFRYNPNGQEAVVPLENRGAGGYLLAFDNTGGTSTGIAVNNASAQQVNIPVVIRDDTGLQIGSASLTLAANGHSAFTLGTDKYPAAANIRGTIEFDAPAGSKIGALGIRIPPAHTFTTLPALAK